MWFKTLLEILQILEMSLQVLVFYCVALQVLRCERVVEELPLKNVSALKCESLKIMYEVTSDPDSFLCLAVVYVCYEALKMLSGSVQRYITESVQSDVWLPQEYFLSLCVLCCTIT